MASDDIVQQLLAEMKAQREEMKSERELFKAQLEAKEQQVEQMLTMLKAQQGLNGSNGSKSALDIMHDISQRVPQFDFDGEIENCFSLWYDRYQSVFTVDASSLDDKSKVRVLLERLRDTVFNQYKSHILPVAPDVPTYDETVLTLKKLFDHSLSMFTQRFQVLRVEKAADMDLLAYYGMINEMCEKAEIGKIKMDEWKALLFIYGLKESKFSGMRKRLVLVMDKLHKDGKDITMKTIYDEAQMFICTQRDANVIGNHQKALTSTEVCQVATWTCWNCGRSHERGECQKPKVTCHRCNGKGHLQKFCDQANKGRGNKNEPRKKFVKVNSAHIYAVKVEKKGLEPHLFIPKPLQRKVMINGMPVDMKMDTCAQVSLLNDAVWKKLGKPRLRKPDVEIRGPSRELLDIRGVFDCTYTVNGFHFTGEAYVNPHKNLFGLDWINKVPQLQYHAQMLVNSGLGKEDVAVKPDKVAPRQSRCTKKLKTVDVCYVETNSDGRSSQLRQNCSAAGQERVEASMGCDVQHTLTESKVPFPKEVEEIRKETCHDVLRPVLKEDLSRYLPKKTSMEEESPSHDQYVTESSAKSDFISRKSTTLCPTILKSEVQTYLCNDLSNCRTLRNWNCLLKQYDQCFEKGGGDADKRSEVDLATGVRPIAFHRKDVSLNKLSQAQGVMAPSFHSKNLSRNRVSYDNDVRTAEAWMPRQLQHHHPQPTSLPGSPKPVHGFCSLSTRVSGYPRQEFMCNHGQDDGKATTASVHCAITEHRHEPVPLQEAAHVQLITSDQ